MVIAKNETNGTAWCPLVFAWTLTANCIVDNGCRKFLSGTVNGRRLYLDRRLDLKLAPLGNMVALVTERINREK